ncbi:MAG TPA: sigma-70 family RNA polymerase sigma factor [Chthonomonadales bacterium]|nr:sigma-70 family RNA polymerase sigma factor [Chthonomonadales bacterium]
MILRLSPDPELVSACLKGDARAWDELIARYEALIYTVSLRMGLSRADADDVFQEVCLLLLNHLHEVRDVKRLAGWLISTTRREAFRVRRKRSNTVSLDAGEQGWEPGEILPGLEAAGNTPEQEILALEERYLVRQALERLPDRCKKLLTMLYTQEIPGSYVETANALGIPLGSIGPSRARCLERLRKALLEIGF